MPARPHVVIVGAGFGGLNLVKALRRAPVEITVIDRQNFHTFQPLLYQVATAALGADDIAHSIRGIFKQQTNVRVRLGTIRGVDWERRHVLVEEGEPVPFDYLVLAAGATTATFSIPGVDEHAFFLKSLPDALRLRNHILGQFEQAETRPELIDQGALTFVLVGGGPTGVELAGAFIELFTGVLDREFHDLDISRVRVVLVEALDHLLGPFRPRLRDYARRTLEARGVEVVMGRAIESVTEREVCLADGVVVASETVVWAAGVRAVPLADASGLEQAKDGRIVVGPDLQVYGHPQVFVIGDLAWCSGPDGRPYPQVAPVAIQGARHVARQIVTGRSWSFRYRDKGIMATIGRNSAVAQLPPGLAFGGFPAWVAWLALHLVMLIGFRNRANVVINWAWNYLTYDRGARLIVSAGSSKRGGL